jgi:transposase
MRIMKQLKQRFKNYKGEALTNYLARIKDLQGFEQVKEFLMSVKFDEEVTNAQNIDEVLIHALENEVIEKKEQAKSLAKSIDYLKKTNKDLSIHVKEELINLRKLIESYTDAIQVFDEEADEFMDQHLKTLVGKALDKKEQLALLELFRSKFKRNTCFMDKKNGLSLWLDIFCESFYHHYEKAEGSNWCDLYIVEAA